MSQCHLYCMDQGEKMRDMSTLPSSPMVPMQLLNTPLPIPHREIAIVWLRKGVAEEQRIIKQIKII